MSSILQALEKKKKSQTTEVGRRDSISAQSTPPSIRAKRKRWLVLAPLIAVPVLVVVAVAGVYLHQAATSGPETVDVTTPPEPVVMVAQGTVHTDDQVPIVDERPPEPAVDEKPVPGTGVKPPALDEKPVEGERIDKVTGDLESLREALSKMTGDNAKPGPDATIAERPWKPPVHDGSPSVTELSAGGSPTGAQVPPQPVEPETVEPGPSADDTLPDDTAPEAEIDSVAQPSEEPEVEQTVPPVTDTATVEPAPVAPQPLTEAPDIPLDGIAAGPGGKCAIINGQLLEVGDIYDEWEITEIGDGFIRVRGWDRKIYLH